MEKPSLKLLDYLPSIVGELRKVIGLSPDYLKDLLLITFHRHQTLAIYLVFKEINSLADKQRKDWIEIMNLAEAHYSEENLLLTLGLFLTHNEVEMCRDALLLVLDVEAQDKGFTNFNDQVAMAMQVAELVNSQSPSVSYQSDEINLYRQVSESNASIKFLCFSERLLFITHHYATKEVYRSWIARLGNEA